MLLTSFSCAEKSSSVKEIIKSKKDYYIKKKAKTYSQAANFVNQFCKDVLLDSKYDVKIENDALDEQLQLFVLYFNDTEASYQKTMGTFEFFIHELSDETCYIKIIVDIPDSTFLFSCMKEAYTLFIDKLKIILDKYKKSQKILFSFMYFSKLKYNENFKSKDFFKQYIETLFICDSSFNKLDNFRNKLFSEKCLLYTKNKDTIDNFLHHLMMLDSFSFFVKELNTTNNVSIYNLELNKRGILLNTDFHFSITDLNIIFDVQKPVIARKFDYKGLPLLCTLESKPDYSTEITISYQDNTIYQSKDCFPSTSSKEILDDALQSIALELAFNPPMVAFTTFLYKNGGITFKHSCFNSFFRYLVSETRLSAIECNHLFYLLSYSTYEDASYRFINRTFSEKTNQSDSSSTNEVCYYCLELTIHNHMFTFYIVTENAVVTNYEFTKDNPKFSKFALKDLIESKVLPY